MEYFNNMQQRVISCVALYPLKHLWQLQILINPRITWRATACNKKLTTYKQSINVAMWYVWYCSNFHSKKKRGKERKIFKSQKKKYPFFAFPFFQYFETWEKLTTNSPATSEQNFVQKANWTNNETFRIFKIPAISSIEAKKKEK